MVKGWCQGFASSCQHYGLAGGSGGEETDEGRLHNGALLAAH